MCIALTYITCVSKATVTTMIYLIVRSMVTKKKKKNADARFTLVVVVVLVVDVKSRFDDKEKIPDVRRDKHGEG